MHVVWGLGVWVSAFMFPSRVQRPAGESEIPEDRVAANHDVEHIACTADYKSERSHRALP